MLLCTAYGENTGGICQASLWKTLVLAKSDVYTIHRRPYGFEEFPYRGIRDPTLPAQSLRPMITQDIW